MYQKIIGLILILGCLAVPSAQAVGLEVAIGGWQQSIDGHLSYQALVDSDSIDLEDDMQFDDETRICGRAKIDLPVFFPNIYLVGAPAEFEGTGRKSVTFKYGDTTFDADSEFSSKITVNQYDIGFYYGLPFVETGSAGLFNVDVGLNVRIVDFEGSIIGTSGGNTVEESESITVPVPMLYLGVQLMPTDSLMIEAEGRGIAIDDNKLYSLTGRVSYHFTGPVFIAGGYRYDMIEIDEEDVIAEVDFSGPFIEFGLEF